MKQIRVTPSERRTLQERFGVKESYVLEVLRYKKDGPTAREIRKEALRMGGRYVDPEFAPNCRTQYLGGTIVQTFSDDVVLRIELKSGDVTISHRGNVIDRVQNATMTMWNSMAIQAQEIAETAMVAR
jgi:hypothetical protein